MHPHLELPRPPSQPHPQAYDKMGGFIADIMLPKMTVPRKA